MKSVILVPAGPRAVLDGRPEYLARQDWGRTKEALEASEAGIGFGFELKAIEKYPVDFDPNSLNGLPYAMHAANECLTQLYQAELDGNQAFIDEFWARIAAWAKWIPSPLYVNFHGAGLGTIPPIDENRFNLMITPEEWLKRADWHIGIFKRMREMGLSVTLETMYLNNYYGPPYFEKNWLPITYLSPRVGIFDDLFGIVSEAGIGSVVDFEHLEAAVQSLNFETVEYKELQKPVRADDGSFEFFGFFGFEAEQGKIPSIISEGRASWEEQVWELNTPFYHVGSINPQVFDLSEDDVQTEYHAALQRQLEGNPYAQQLVCNRRGGSHDAVRSSNKRFMEMLNIVLCQTRPEPSYLCIETSNRGEGKGPDVDPGYWYWAEPDALGTSLTNLRQILLSRV